MKQKTYDKLHLKESEVPESTNGYLDFSTPDALNREYYLGKNGTHGKTIVRPGFYFIKEVSSKEDAKLLYASAYWHPLKPEFLSEPIFEICLNQLRNIRSSGPAEFSISAIIDKVIEIKSVRLVENEWEKETYKSYAVKWDFVKLAHPPQIEIAEAIEYEIQDTLHQANFISDFTQEENDKSDEEELLQILLENMDADDEENEELQLIYDEQRDEMDSEEGLVEDEE